MAIFRAFCAAILAVTGSVSLSAQGPPATAWTEVHGSRVRLVGGEQASGGTRYLAGVEMALSDGWKTYWRMPGDAGVPPTFDWSGSTNLAKAQVLYPAPLRMPEAGGAAVGYKGAVVLPIRVTPKDASAPVSLKLALEFGICREICIPAQLTFDLNLTPGKTGSPPEALTAAVDQVPRPHHARRKGDPELKRVRVLDASSPVRLAIEGIFQGRTGKADIFVEAPDGLYVPMLSRIADGSNGPVVRFESPLSPDLAKDLTGKTLTLTLVDDAGATETRWTFP